MLVAAELADPPHAKINDYIYGATPAALITVVRDLPDDAGTALLVGHNPGLQEFVALLTGREPEMKTSSVAILAWSGRWADAAAHTASLRHNVPRVGDGPSHPPRRPQSHVIRLRTVAAICRHVSKASKPS